MWKAILWDNDGVLVDTEGLYYQATRDTLARVGVRLSEDDYIELFLRQSRGAWHLARERGMSADDVAALTRDRDELYGRLIDRGPTLIPGVAATVRRLQGRFRMAIVTSSEAVHFARIHRDPLFLGQFELVLTRGHYQQSKPHPEPYLRALERMALAPAECVVIEDSERVRVVTTTPHDQPERAFHPKSWRFETQTFGVAFAGSSNVSRSALESGVEWNLRVDRAIDPAAYAAIADAFAALWASAIVLTATWIDDYQRRARVDARPLPPGEAEPEPLAPPRTPRVSAGSARRPRCRPRPGPPPHPGCARNWPWQDLAGRLRRSADRPVDRSVKRSAIAPRRRLARLEHPGPDELL